MALGTTTAVGGVEGSAAISCGAQAVAVSITAAKIVRIDVFLFIVRLLIPLSIYLSVVS
jgi:hypothetical protein